MSYLIKEVDLYIPVAAYSRMVFYICLLVTVDFFGIFVFVFIQHDELGGKFMYIEVDVYV